jgi:16S rRNA processing protein RimM
MPVTPSPASLVPLPIASNREELLPRIALAAVAGAHGVRGELRLKLFSDSIDSLSLHQSLYIGGVERRLLSIRDSGKTAVARFDGIADRAAAETLRGSLVEVDRSQLPPLEEGEYYHADLIGLPALDRHGAAVGTVVAVENYGAGDLLEIELADGKRSLIPFRAGIADLDGDRIVVDPEFLA